MNVGRSRKTISTLDACNQAAKMLKEAGLIPIYVSRKSEAVYYGLRGVDALIRVATHKQKHAPRGLPGTVVAKITFGSEMSGMPGFTKRSDEKIINAVYMAVGRWYLAVHAKADRA